jgi:dienelactone hydrolase
MTTFKDVNDLFRHAFDLYMQENYTGAFDLVTQGLELFPENRNFTEGIRAMLAARLNNTDLAFTLLRQMFDGTEYWVGERFWLDGDFDTIRDDPEFERLAAVSNARLAAAQAGVKPELTTFAPDPLPVSLPLLVALHGNVSSVFWHKDHWSPAADHGWLVAMPQSSQLGGHDTNNEYAFSWDDEPKVDQEIREHYTALKGRYSLDNERIVVAGFSRGAENAVRLAFQGVIPARGFIAVCPGGPYSHDPASWDSVLETAAGRDLRGYVIVGGQDTHGEGGKTLVEKLRAADFAVELAVYDDMGHDYPPDFGVRLPEMLAFVLGG